MYESFFGLREKPFSLLPDSRYLYFSGQHQEALTLLEYGLVNQAGFTVLTGEIGVGKTTLMRALLDRLEGSLTIGLISHTHQSLGTLMDWICLAFGLDVEKGSRLAQHQSFVEFAIDQYAKGKRTLLILDEAQNLDRAQLEELRLLSNINSDRDLVLQVMLLGQPQLRERLRAPDMQQFVQRIAAAYHLGCLDVADTARYIAHRLAVAGGEPEIFSASACSAVHHYSGGVPRLINLICDTSLVYAYGAGKRIVSAEIVDEFAASQAGHLLIPLQPRAVRNEEAAAGEALKERASSSNIAEERAADCARTGDNGSVGAQRTTDVQCAAEDSTSDSGWQKSPRADRLDSERVAPKVEVDRQRSSPASGEVTSRPQTIGSAALSAHSGAVRSRSTVVYDEPSAGAPELLTPVPTPGVDNLTRSQSNRNLDGLAYGTTAAKVQSEPGWTAGNKSGWEWRIGVFVGILAAAGGAVWFVGTDSSDFVRAFIDPDLQQGKTSAISGQGEGAGDLQAAGENVVIDTPVAGDSPSDRTRESSVTETDRGRGESASRVDGHEEPAHAGSLPDGAGRFAGADAGLRVPTATIGDEPAVPFGSPQPSEAAPGALDPGPAAEIHASTIAEDRTDPFDDSAGPFDHSVAEAQGASAADRDRAGLGEPEPVLGRGSDHGLLHQAFPQEREEAVGQVDHRGDGITPSASPMEPDTLAEDSDRQMRNLREALDGLDIDVDRADGSRFVANLREQVQFPSGGIQLAAKDRAFLDALADRLSALRLSAIHVVGHTDHVGPAGINQRLSERRAAAVAEQLATGGIPREMLSYEGKGESAPLVTVEREWVLGPAANRRIEIELVALKSIAGDS